MQKFARSSQKFLCIVGLKYEGWMVHIFETVVELGYSFKNELQYSTIIDVILSYFILSLNLIKNVYTQKFT